MKIKKTFPSFLLLFLCLFSLNACSNTMQLKSIEAQLNSLENTNYKTQANKILFNVQNEAYKPSWGFNMQEIQYENVRMELLQRNFKADYLIIQIHGGGFQSPITDIYRKNAENFIKRLPVDVLTPDYRTSPQYQYPAALDDVFMAWQWAIENGYKAKNIVFSGDSAGGNLALALALRLKSKQLPLPSALVLMSPFVDLTLSFDSHKRNLEQDLFFNYKRGTNPFYTILTSENISQANYILDYAGKENLDNPFISPYFADLSGLPPMLIQVGTREVLEDDSIMLYQKAIQSGIDARLTKYEDMYHVFQLSQLPKESKKAWQEIHLFIKDILEIKDESFEIGPAYPWKDKAVF